MLNKWVTLSGGAMPHFNIEYSANLDGRVDIQGLCDAIHAEILSTGLFELGAVRVRACRFEAFAIADRHPENAFIDMSFRIGQGRSEDEKKIVGERIFAAASRHLAALFEAPHFALSLEIRELDPVLMWRKNAIHPRIRASSAAERP
jgi:5-carboxymethyl-2-hydroxymuconate isomerase